MFKLVGLIIVTVLLGSCSDSSALMSPNPNNLEKKIMYMKDSRTGICFAFLRYTVDGRIGDSQSMTCVPCEQIPESLIKTKDLK